MNKAAVCGFIITAALALSAGVKAQESAPPDNSAPASVGAASAPLGTIEHANPAPLVHGGTTTLQPANATIVFKPAGTNNLNSAGYAQWTVFAQAHPAIARELAYHPSSANDAHFLQKHPALAEFYRTHPKVHEELAANPGNFAAIPPRPGE